MNDTMKRISAVLLALLFVLNLNNINSIKAENTNSLTITKNTVDEADGTFSFNIKLYKETEESFFVYKHAYSELFKPDGSGWWFYGWRIDIFFLSPEQRRQYGLDDSISYYLSSENGPLYRDEGNDATDILIDDEETVNKIMNDISSSTSYWYEGVEYPLNYDSGNELTNGSEREASFTLTTTENIDIDAEGLNKNADGTYSFTINTQDSNTFTIPDLPADCQYEIYEEPQDSWELVSVNEQDPVTDENNKAVISAMLSDLNSVVFLNRKNGGSNKTITLKKTWDDLGDRYGLRPETLEAWIKYELSSGSGDPTEQTLVSGEWNKDGNTWTTVFEIPENALLIDWGEDVLEDYELSKETFDDSTNTITLTNSLKTHKLTIKKNVVNEDSFNTLTDYGFEFTIKIWKDNSYVDVRNHSTHRIGRAATSDPYFISDVGNHTYKFYLYNQETIDFINIPHGYNYLINELNNDGYESYEAINGQGVIEEDIEALFNSQLKHLDLTITKEVEDDVQGEFDFEIEIFKKQQLSAALSSGIYSNGADQKYVDILAIPHNSYNDYFSHDSYFKLVNEGIVTRALVKFDEYDEVYMFVDENTKPYRYVDGKILDQDGNEQDISLLKVVTYIGTRSDDYAYPVYASTDEVPHRLNSTTALLDIKNRNGSDVAKAYKFTDVKLLIGDIEQDIYAICFNNSTGPYYSDEYYYGRKYGYFDVKGNSDDNMNFGVFITGKTLPEPFYNHSAPLSSLSNYYYKDTFVDYPEGFTKAQNGKYLFKLKTGESLTIPDIPYGFEYEVYEIDSRGNKVNINATFNNSWTYVSSENASGTLNGDTEAVFTNRTVLRELRVYKDTVDNEEGLFDFNIKVFKTVDGQTYYYDLSPFAQATDTEGVYRFQLKNSQHKSFNLPDGYQYEIWEDLSDEWQLWKKDRDKGTVNMYLDYSYSHPRFTNRKKTQLTFSKEVTGDSIDETKEFEFDVRLKRYIFLQENNTYYGDEEYEGMPRFFKNVTKVCGQDPASSDEIFNYFDIDISQYEKTITDVYEYDEEYYYKNTSWKIEGQTAVYDGVEYPIIIEGGTVEEIWQGQETEYDYFWITIGYDEYMDLSAFGGTSAQDGWYTFRLKHNDTVDITNIEHFGQAYDITDEYKGNPWEYEIKEKDYSDEDYVTSVDDECGNSVTGTMTEDKYHAFVNEKKIPDLTVSKTADVSSARLYDEITYTITVTNNGNGKVEDLTVTDTLGEGLAYKSSDPEGTHDGQVTTWNITELEANSSKTFTLVATVTDTAGDKVSNTVSVVDPDDPDNPIEDTEEVIIIKDEYLTITYKLNGGSYAGSTDDIVETYKKGTVIDIHAAPVREGYKFLYWRGSKYMPNDKYSVEDNHTFTAQWEKISTPSDSKTYVIPKTGIE